MRYDIDSIKSKYDLRQVIPQTSKRRHFDGYDADCCPFHEDQSPSMLIHVDGYVCKTPSCGKKGDIVTWIMETRHVNFREACDLLGGDQLEMKDLPIRERPKSRVELYNEDDHPDLAESDPDAFASGMGDDDYLFLRNTTMIEQSTARIHQLGRWNNRVYTIPIYDPRRLLVDMKLYRPQPMGNELKVWHWQNKSHNALYGFPYLNVNTDFAVLVGGEKDSIMGHQMQLPFLTATSGEGSWHPFFNRYLAQFKRVYVWFDADEAGEAGMLKVKRDFPRAILCSWKLLYDRFLPSGFDFSDYAMEGGTRDQFMEMLESAQRGVFSAKPIFDRKLLLSAL